MHPVGSIVVLLFWHQRCSLPVRSRCDQTIGEEDHNNEELCGNRSAGMCRFRNSGATLSHAQVLMKAHVPFSFRAGGGRLPAGDYSIIETGMTSEPVLLRAGLRGVELIMPNNTESRNDVSSPKLVFHRYGDEYFLAEIWTSADDSVRKLKVNPRERKLAKAGVGPEVAAVYGVSSSRSRK